MNSSQILSLLIYVICFVFFTYVLAKGVREISAGFQTVKLGERGGHRRDFHDLGINTRQAIEHVRESKTGECQRTTYTFSERIQCWVINIQAVCLCLIRDMR